MFRHEKRLNRAAILKLVCDLQREALTVEVRLHASVSSLYPNTIFRGQFVLLRLRALLALGLVIPVHPVLGKESKWHRRFYSLRYHLVFR